MAKEVLITGSTGLVGSRFVELSPQLKLLTPSHQEFDLLNQRSVGEYLDRYQPDLLINFAAYTNVTQAESHADDKDSPSWQLNVVGVENLLQANIPLIQISTDMVFSGATDDPGPYTEDHQPETDSKHLTWYGWTKAVAEEKVLKKNGTLVRIIYPVRAHFPPKLDYLRGPLHLYAQGKLYPLFDDQQVSFTFIDELAVVLQKLVDNPAPGIYHVSSNTFTLFDMVSYAVEKLGGDPSTIQSSKIRPFLQKQANPYRYPVKGGLSVKQTEEKLRQKFKNWQQVVDELISQKLALK